MPETRADYALPTPERATYPVASATVAVVLSLNSGRDPASPFVTFYDDATGERTELSSTSLQNWVAKTANYLRDGLGIAAGAQISLQIPMHWIVPVWVAAARSVGAHLVFPSESNSEVPDLAVIGPDQLAHPPAADTVVACSLLPLAQPFTQLPHNGIEDFFGEVRIYGDFFSGLTLGADPTLTNQTKAAIERWGLTRGDRLLITTQAELNQDAILAVYDVPQSIAGSSVIVTSSTPERLAIIAAEERISTHIQI